MCCEGLDMMLLNSDQAMAQRGFPNRPDLSRPLTGRGVLIFLGLFFGFMFVANGALIYTALSTLHGEELANSYDASQDYNQRIADARAQEQLGWVADVTTRQEGRGERVVADFSDRDGAPISGLDVRARFVHPFDRDADREAILSSDGGGRLRRRRRVRFMRAGGPSSSRRRRTDSGSSRARTRSRSRRPLSGTNRWPRRRICRFSFAIPPKGCRRWTSSSRASIAAPASARSKRASVAKAACAARASIWRASASPSNGTTARWSPRRSSSD